MKIKKNEQMYDSLEKIKLKANLFRLTITLVFFSAIAFAALWKFALEGGTIGHNWDWSISPLPVQLRYLAGASFYVWSETSFWGPASTQIHFRFLSLFLGSFGYMGLTGDFVSKFLVFFIIVVSGTSMFYLVHSILKKENEQLRSNYDIFYPSLLAGYFYALSPFLFADFIGGAYTQLFAYSIIPAVLYSFRKMVSGEARLKYILLLTIFLSFLSVSSSRFLLTVIILLLYASVQSKRMIAIKGLLISFLLYIPLNSYWIIPSLYEFAAGTSAVVVSPQLIYQANLVNGVPSIIEASLGVGYSRPFFVWVLEKTILPIWAIISFSFLACILTFVLLYHKTREALFWVALYTLSLMVVTVGKSPISGLILWMYMNIPLMVLYRSPQHLLILTILPLSIILGIGAFTLCSFIQKKTAHFPTTKRKTLATLLIMVMFISVSIWVSPFFTGNLGADYLRDKKGGNYVDTFELSPDLIAVLERIHNESAKDIFRSLFLPPASSPYYIETDFQKEGQGGDVVIGSTPRGVSDTYTRYNELIVTLIRDSFLEGKFKDPWLLEVASIKYIILRNDVNPIFGPKANLWNFSRTLSNLKEINGMKLIYQGPHVSLWEYENYRPFIRAARKLVNTTTTISFDEIKLLSFKTESNNISSQPLIHFKQINPTTYTVHVFNATEPFYLIFSEAYDPAWQVYEDPTNLLESFHKKPLTAEHLIVNGYANAWHISKIGSYTITLEFWPQRLFYIGATISATTLTLCILHIGEDKIKNICKRYIRKQKTKNKPLISFSPLPSKPLDSS